MIPDPDPCPHYQVGTFTLFQESYHRETFAKMHVSGPKSDYDHRLLTQVGQACGLGGRRAQAIDESYLKL